LLSIEKSDVDGLIGLLRRCCKFVETSDVSRVSPDPDDDKFIACSLTGNAEFLVTGNKKHFPQNQLSAVKLVSAGELLELITLEL